MHITFHPIAADFVARIRAGGLDANNQPAERAVSEGVGNPCRSCLCDIPAGADMLICAARPFASLQPYAETGPIFLCADQCTPWANAGVPPVLQTSPDYLLKGYDAQDRIVYGTGGIVLAKDIAVTAKRLLSRDKVAYVDVRFARNNCFQTRITQAR